MSQKGEIDFSRAVIEAFRKRNRALSRRGASVECTPVKEIVDGRESEVGRADINIEYRVDAARVVLRLQIWDDRWLRLDVRRSSKSGWVWESTNEGRFVSPGGARDLVSQVEETLSASYLPAADVPRAISTIWSRFLAIGLRTV